MIAENRGLARKLKYVLPKPIFRVTRRILNQLASWLPHGIKYTAGAALKRRKYPYCLIGSDDVVIQVGAPLDLVYTGRSRAITFSKLARKGLVVVVEPDPGNCQGIKAYCRKYNLEENIQLICKGAWSSEDTLSFLSSRGHPSSNLVVGTNEVDETAVNERQYEEIRIPVSSIDAIVQDLRIDTTKIRLISITTNGAELEILRGMKEILGKADPHIALAETGESYLDALDDIGYELIARDDRGFTFSRTTDSG